MTTSPGPLFAVRDVPADVVRDDVEPLGTKRKFWYRDEARTRWLFKYGRPDTGEHWAERIAADVARSLGLPCAEVELARHAGDWGTVSRDFTDDHRFALVHGNELLGEQSPDYPADRRYRVKEHTLEAIYGVLSQADIGLPDGVGLMLPEPRAFALFAGYLLLDAVIGNTDRHHENWGVLLSTAAERILVLAPTFDHASSLGRELGDDKRRARLEVKDDTRSLAGYAEGTKVRSAIYRARGDVQPMAPLEAFLACGELAPATTAVWIDRLDVAQERLLDWERRVDAAILSETAAAFAGRLIRHNVARVLRCRP